jgi:8-oxo-dGTP diphosphatase
MKAEITSPRLRKHRHKRFPLAVHVALLRGDKVLLLRRYNTGYEDGNYGVVAGHLKGGESVRQAAIREAREEVGVRIASKCLRIVGLIHRLAGGERLEFFLLADSWEGKIRNAEPKKCDRLRWCSLNHLPSNTIPYVANALRRSRLHLWFSEPDWVEKGTS